MDVVFAWLLLIQVVYPDGNNDTIPHPVKSKQECLEILTKVLDQDPREFKAQSIGGACIKEIDTSPHS